MSAMFEFRRLYCPHAKLHAPFPFDGLLMCSIVGQQVLLSMLAVYRSIRLWGRGNLVRSQPHPCQHPDIGVFPLRHWLTAEL